MKSSQRIVPTVIVHDVRPVSSSVWDTGINYEKGRQRTDEEVLLAVTVTSSDEQALLDATSSDQEQNRATLKVRDFEDSLTRPCRPLMPSTSDDRPLAETTYGQLFE